MAQQRGGGAGGAGVQRPNGASQGRICQFKLVLLGESAVGKSSLVLRFVKGQFHEYQESTIGAAFLTQTLSMEDSEVKFEIWDTAGQVIHYFINYCELTNPCFGPPGTVQQSGTDVLPRSAGRHRSL